MIITPGPRALWDTGRQIATPEGALSGLRYRGSDQLRYVISAIMRGIEIGFRGFLVVDEGLLWALTELKRLGEIPPDAVFKVSIFAGHASAAGGKVLESLGAGTFNPVADLSLPQLASIRQAINIPMDIHVYLFDSFGGFNRFYETPEMVRVCAPCYFKIEPGPGVGGLYKPWVSPDSLAFMAREKVKYAQTIMELVQSNLPEARVSALGAADLAIPRP
ncbi:MAG: peptidase [Chloroflexi bacterium]|nr:peptidase [Chloroflexota bacterium]